MRKEDFKMDLEIIKNQICDVCNKMWQKGWVAANDGNVSVRLEDGTFLCTPTGISKSFITPDKLVRINSDYEILEAGEGYRPSSEVKMHLRVYQDRKDVNGVVHAHPPVATAFALAKIPLDSYSLIENAIAVGSIPIAPFGIPSTEEVPESIAPFLPEHDVLLLENHGALSVGSDLITAYYRMETLELVANTVFHARMLLGGKEEDEIDRDTLDKLFAMRENYKVTGKHPGYKKYH